MVITIGHDIYDKEGNLLLAKGYQCDISEPSRQRLQRLGLLSELMRSEPKVPEQPGSAFTAQSTPVIQMIGKTNIIFNPLLAGIMSNAASPSNSSMRIAYMIVENLLFKAKDKAWQPFLGTLSHHVEWLYSHSINTALVSCLIGVELKYSRKQLEELAIGALLHDIGQTLLPKSVLEKPGKLTEAEMIIVRSHCEMGYSMLTDFDIPEVSHTIVLQHHERVNGTGYPCGLTGDKMLEESRIVAIAETFDTATTVRPYKAAKSVAAILKEIDEQKDCYDNRLVRHLTAGINS